MQTIIDTIVNVANAFFPWLTSFWTWFWDFETDIVLWIWEQSLSMLDGVFAAIMVLLMGWNTFTLGALYSALPADVAGLLSLIRFPEFIAMIAAAYVVKLTEKLLIAAIP